MMRMAILYLDDDATQLELFRDMFGREYDVETSASAREALRSLAACPADIIISDYAMPEGKGTDFLREAAQVYPSSFRVLLTGRITFGEVLPEVGQGLVHLFLPKPWTEAEMRAALERAAAELARGLRAEMMEEPPPRGKRPRRGGAERRAAKSPTAEFAHYLEGEEPLLEDSHVGLYIFLRGELRDTDVLDLEQAAAGLSTTAAKAGALLARLEAVGLVSVGLVGGEPGLVRVRLLPPLGRDELKRKRAGAPRRVREPGEGG